MKKYNISLTLHNLFKCLFENENIDLRDTLYDLNDMRDPLLVSLKKNDLLKL